MEINLFNVVSVLSISNRHQALLAFALDFLNIVQVEIIHTGGRKGLTINLGKEEESN